MNLKTRNALAAAGLALSLALSVLAAPVRAAGDDPSQEAIDNAVPMPVIAASLFARFASRQPVSPALQAVAALRGQFGGHAVMTVAEGENLRATAPESAGAKASPGQAPAAAKVAAKKTTTRRAAPKASPAH